MANKRKANKRPRWVLVTGAASGIGAELCGLFAKSGANLILIDKNRDGLEEMSQSLGKRFGIQTLNLVYDLSSPESPSQIFDELQRRQIEVEVLVNNAGFGTFGDFWEIEPERDQALVNLNILAPMLLTKLFLPAMVQRKRGKILNVGSVSGFLASPHATTYYSSKAWLLSFSQGLATSLQNTGVSVTIVCPGPTHTGFNWHSEGKANGENDAPPPRKPFQMEASVVAAQAYRGLHRGQMIVIPGVSNRFLALLAKLLPRKLALRLVSLGQDKAN